MNASDLMIGDWVQHEEGVCKVISIATNGIYFEDSVSEGVATIDRIHPILITPEILEKNGFEYERNTGYVYDDQMGIMVGYSTFPGRLRIIKDLSILYDSQDGWDISVHQLQHALKLCGIEKTIEL